MASVAFVNGAGVPEAFIGRAQNNMHVSVTALGTDSGAVGRAADQIVGYLEGPGRLDGASEPGPEAQSPNEHGVVGYFADSTESAGEWRGEAAVELGLSGPVKAEAFRRVLMGSDPSSGVRLATAQGSSGRAALGHRLSKRPEWLSPREVAEMSGVDASYVRKLIRESESGRWLGDDREMDGSAFLSAFRDGGRWRIARDEAERFAASRQAARVVMAYDVTFSAPKSVSIIWAQGSDEVRSEVDAAIDAGVEAGLSYLQRHGLGVRDGGRVVQGSGLVAAAYRHNTNRALEPQIHHHVVVANMTRSPRGWRAVDSRRLFSHATTAGYVAGAEMRHQLSMRLAVEWDEPNRGLADVSGIERDTIMAVSSRRREVLSLAAEMGFDSAAARQAAALATRPAKQASVDAVELRESWQTLLADNGFGPDELAGVQNQQRLEPWAETDTEDLFRVLGSAHGVTEQAAVFDRRDVVQAVAGLSNDRLDADSIEQLADDWLRTDAVVPLAHETGVDVDAFESGLFTTPEMLALEQRVIDFHDQRRGLGYGATDAALVEAAITQQPVELGADQAAMVRAICTSGDQFQAVVGRAGAGKTTAITAAADAWQADGYRVVGAAPFGDAARKLEDETGLRSWTLEGMLTRIETAGEPFLDSNTIVVVDEASTIGNRQLDRLYRHARDAGATVRTIGDPLQHQSVEAGGLWKHLTEQFPEHTPVLDTQRRQVGPHMAEVRLAVDEYREGLIGAALQRLDQDGRVITAGSWEGLLDVMAADWVVDHRQHLAAGAEPSKMVAERNSDRHALNTRAQALLRSEGVLHSPVEIGEAEFHVGDRVVAQVRDTALIAGGADARRHVVNGSEGTVIAIAAGREPGLRVAFDGLGTIEVPHDFIAEEVAPGRGGGLAPAYAVTSFKAEGQTYAAGRNLAAAGSVNAEGMYVALTRGRHDQRIYTIDPALRRTDVPELPVIADARTAVEALTDSLSKRSNAGLAILAGRTRRQERSEPPGRDSPGR